MKKLFFLLTLAFTILVTQEYKAQTPVGEDYVKVTLSSTTPFDLCQVSLLEDDIVFNQGFIKAKDNTVTLYLKEYSDYYLKLFDGAEYNDVNITITAYEPLDDRDYSISLNGTYKITKNNIRLNFDQYTVRE